ncbi:MAG TPA: DUF6596 domain-containing protein [Marmoricola sp.]|nr:DUF6596 domain-containing protein [Marmoricola sp.]
MSDYVEGLLRELAPQVLGALVRRYSDFDDAEDATQEALLAAALQWPASGVPDNPRGWLITVGARRLIDLVRSDAARRLREEREARLATADIAQSATEPASTDDSLALMFLCCHPVLTPASAIPLTLRAVGGLSTAEIAAAFLVPEATMAQRISRAKRRIADAGARFEEPAPAEAAERLPSVLHTLYLVFNEGYASSAGAELARRELSGEAIRLTRSLYATVPEDPEVTGLLALMLLTDARRQARTTAAGALIPLADQDRSLWDSALIEEGTRLISAALTRRRLGEYQLQAAVAAVHAEAPNAEATDWPRIAALYALHERTAPNPVVTLNRAIAVAMVEGPGGGPEAGLELLAGLDGQLGDHHRLLAARAHLHELAGRGEVAAALYADAAARATSQPERDHLTLAAARLTAQSR